MARWFEEYKRQKMVCPYVIHTNTRGREYFNRILVPYFSEFFKDGDRILFVGKHPVWDYSPFFNSPAKQCEYIVTDIEPEMEPDIVDNIAHSKFEDNSFDGIILVGVYDSLKQANSDEVTSEVRRLLKPGGRILVAWNGTEGGKYDPHESWKDFIVDEVRYIWGSSLMEEGKDWFGEGDCQGIFIIARNRPK
jgi:SAM-dependent methyltransferase